MGEELEKHLARKGRIAGLVIAGAMVLWLLANLLGREMGLPARYAFLFDFAAIGALIWALVVVYQIWRARQTGNTNGQG